MTLHSWQAGVNSSKTVGKYSHHPLMFDRRGSVDLVVFPNSNPGPDSRAPSSAVLCAARRDLFIPHHLPYHRSITTNEGYSLLTSTNYSTILST